MTDELRVKAIKTASWVGIIVNSILALLKITTGFWADSMSVLADGIDSSADVFSSSITLYIASLLSKPPSIKFPYGYAKAETNATNALAFIIFIAGFQLAIASIKKLISGEITNLPATFAIYILVISIVGKLILALYQKKMGDKTNSSMLLATAKNMQSDVLISFSVLAGLVLSHLFHLPILDPIAALLVATWIIWVAVRIFIQTNMELMDSNVDQEIYEEVFKLVESIEGVKNPHRLRIRKIGPKKNINVDIELDSNLRLVEAHRIAHSVEDEIKNKIANVFDVSIHIEPEGDHIDEKNLGISKEGLKKKKN
jgi:cation diffusion facilitator family transporter